MPKAPATAAKPRKNAPAGAKLAERIRERIATRLGDRIRALEVKVKGKRIRLIGECSTYYSKQLAQHAALGVIEDETLENRIRVGLPGQPPV